MLRPLAVAIALVVSFLTPGCTPDPGSDGDAGEGEGGGEGEGEGEGEDRCVTGCEATIAVACANGPASQAQCEADCATLRTGPCATPYEALLACDGVVACDAGGIPTVTGCEDEQTAFRSCLNG